MLNVQISSVQLSTGRRYTGAAGATPYVGLPCCPRVVEELLRSGVDSVSDASLWTQQLIVCRHINVHAHGQIDAH